MLEYKGYDVITFQGTFNLRLDPELHREAFIKETIKKLLANKGNDYIL